jgi:hypothetical protein
MSRTAICLLTAGASLAAAAQASTVLYVDDDAPPAGDGLTSETAYRFLQDALADAAASGGTVNEIRAAQGTYTPDRDKANPDGNINVVDFLILLANWE